MTGEGRLSYRACRLCPRACGVDRTCGQRGFCGMGDRITAARAALHLLGGAAHFRNAGVRGGILFGVFPGVPVLPEYGDQSRKGRGRDHHGPIAGDL